MDHLILSHFKLYSYQVPLHRPLTLAGNVLHLRRGVILEIIDPDGHRGIGELAPLPGFHSEDLESAMEQLNQVPQISRGLNLQTSGQVLPEVMPDQDLFPSVRFALETAVADLMANRAGYRLDRYLYPDPLKKIRINGLIGRDGGDAGVFAEPGYACLKVKVGDRSVAVDIEWIHHIHRRSSKGVRLRIDANRAWDIEQAIEFIRGLDAIPYDYIEEPLEDPERLPELYHEAKPRIALDESLPDAVPEGSLPDWLHAVILKPARIGSLNQTLKWIDACRSEDKTLVISDMFYTAPGLGMLIALAAAPHLKDVPMGFDTINRLAPHQLVSGFQPDGACFRTADFLDRRNALDTDTLPRIGG